MKIQTGLECGLNHLKLKPAEKKPGGDFSERLVKLLLSLRVQNMSSILSLNDDCFELIFKQLKLEDRVNFALASPRLRRIFQVMHKQKFATFELKQFKRINRKIPGLFCVAGPLMETLTGAFLPNSELMLDYIGVFCTSVKSISIHYTEFGAALNDMLWRVQTLRELDLSVCYLCDEDIIMLRALPHLEILNVSWNSKITGKYLHQLVNLRELNLARNPIKESYLLHICKSLVKLQILDIRHCWPLGESSFPGIDKCALSLQHIKVCYQFKIFKKFKCIARLPNLTTLEITGSGPFFPHLMHFAENNAKQIENLGLYSCELNGTCMNLLLRFRQLRRLIFIPTYSLEDTWCRLADFVNLEKVILKDVNPIVILAMIRNCLKLSRLDICYFKRELKNDFVFEVIDILWQIEKERSACLIFNIYHTSISQEVLTDARYTVAKSIIQLNLFEGYMFDPVFNLSRGISDLN